MKFKKLTLFKCAAPLIVAAFSFGAAASISYSNRLIIETKAELDDSYWSVDSTNKWLTYNDPSYENIEIEQANVDVDNLRNGYVHMMFRVYGSNADDPGGITDLGEKMIMFSEASFVQVDEDNENYGYIVGRTSDMPSIGYDTLVEIYIRRNAPLNGDLPIYEQGWNSFYDSYEFTYYSSQHGGKYYVEEASYSRWSQEFKLKYSPKQYDDYDPQETTITNGTLKEDSDYGRYIEGTAEINGNPQQVRARLIDRDGYDVELNEYQYWYYENDSFCWKSDPQSGYSIVEYDYMFTVSSAIYNGGSKPEENTFDVVYYFNEDEYDCPAISLTGASYVKTSDSEYTVSGDWVNENGTTTHVSIVIHGEIRINEYTGWSYDETAQFFVYYNEGQKSDAIINHADFSIYKENSSRLLLELTITDRSAYQNFTIENCSYTLDGGFYTIAGEWTEPSGIVSGITVKIAEGEVEAYNFSALTYNSSTQSFELVSGEVTYQGTILNCSWIDYYNLGSESLSYLILDYRFEVEGQGRIYSFKVTNLGEVSRTMSGSYVFTGQFEENAPGGSHVVSVNLEFESAIVKDIEVQRGFNYIESSRSLIYIDDNNTSWDVDIQSAVYIEQDNESCFALTYALFSPSGEGDQGSFTLENVTIEAYNETMQSGILVGQNVELFGTTTVSLRASGIIVSDCTVTFSPGEASEASGSMEPQTAHIGVAYPAPECEFSQDQFHFVEWLADNGETYKVGDPIPITSDSLLLTAVFEHDTYSIIYNPNCEEGEYTGVTEPFVTEEQGTYPVSDCGFERTGFNFVGWATKPNGEAQFNANDYIEVYESEIILYAVWEEEVVVNEYIISFDANGGIGSMEPVVISGTETPLSYNLPRECPFEYPGKEFMGWDKNPDSLFPFEPGSVVGIEENTTFYAIWKTQTVYYTISFDANGGVGSMQSVEVPSGNNTVPGCDFTREGYDFIGWAAGSLDGPVYKENDEVYVDGDYTLYALWELKTPPTPTPTPTPGTEYDFRITFKGNGATGGRMAPINCKKGETKAVPECEFIRDGYVFAGWAVDSVDSQIIIQPGQSFEINKDYTLYATWEKRVVEWRYIDMELCWYDSANPEDWAEPTKAVYYYGGTEQEDLIFVTYSIYRFEANDEMGDDVAPIVVREVTIVLKNVNAYEDGEYVNISGTFAEVGQEINVTVLAENYEIGSTEGRNITPAQEAEIRENIPVDQNEKVEEALVVLPDETATEIISVIGSTNSAIDEDESLTPEEKEAAYNSVKKAVEASVVVGAQQVTATEEGDAINEVLPENATINMSDTLNEFYERQMNILLGRTSEPNRSIHRAPDNEENTIDYTIPEDDYGKMISFVDTSVENMENAALQIRDCSGADIINQVNEYIEMIVGSSFRNYDKEAADMAYVEQAHESIMLALQKQVIEALTKDHKPSNDPEKEAQYNEQLEAVKDIDTFKEMVMEVLRLKYVSLTEKEIDIDSFRDIYWNIFKAWALDEPEFNEYGITLEELTNATIETATAKANPIIFRDKLATEEIIFISVAGGVVVLGVGSAIAIPTILKKKRGLAK